MYNSFKIGFILCKSVNTGFYVADGDFAQFAADSTFIDSSCHPMRLLLSLFQIQGAKFQHVNIYIWWL